MGRIWRISCLVLCLSGCANYHTDLVSLDGRRAHCYATGYGIIGSTVATNLYNDCMANFTGKGFVEVAK